MNTMIQLKDVTRIPDGQGYYPALRRVNLTLERAAITRSWGLAVGKSTLLHILGCMDCRLRGSS